MTMNWIEHARAKDVVDLEKRSSGASPKRIQRKRTKGWRMPEGSVYVGRPSKWGNPCKVERENQRSDAVAWFESHIAPTLDVSELRGKDLVCWCSLDKECHADILLKLANK